MRGFFRSSDRNLQEETEKTEPYQLADFLEFLQKETKVMKTSSSSALSALSAQSAINSDPFDLNHFNRRCLRWSQIMKAPIRADPRDPRKIQFLRLLGGFL